MTKNRQNLTLIAVIICLSFIIQGCREVDKLTQFNIEYDETVVIPSNTGINLPIDIVTPPIETNAESKFAINDTRKDMIEEIILIQAEVEVTSPADGDFLKRVLFRHGQPHIPHPVTRPTYKNHYLVT